MRRSSIALTATVLAFVAAVAVLLLLPLQDPHAEAVAVPGAAARGDGPAATSRETAEATPAGIPLPREALPAEGDLDVGEIRLAYGRILRGRVLDRKGAPVTGAVVATASRGLASPALPASALLVPGATPYVVERHQAGGDLDGTERTGADGRFRVLGLRARTARIVVRASGMREHVRNVDLDGDTTNIGDVRLEALGSVAGRVCDANGRPVAGACVRVASGASTGKVGMSVGHPLAAAAYTNPDGTFRAPAPPGAPRWIAVRAEGSPFWHVAGPLGAGAPLDIRLPEKASVLLELRADDGAPLESIHVGMQPCAPGGASLDPLASPLGFSWAMRYKQAVAPALRFVRADAFLHPVPDRPGTWKLPGLPAGSYRLVIEAGGFAPAGGWVSLESGNEVRLRLCLARAIERRFEIVDQSGAPVAGAQLYWQPALAPPSGTDAQQLPPSSLPIALGTSDHSGRVESRALGHCDGTFLVLHPDHVPARRPAGHDNHVRIALERYGAIAGRVEGRDPTLLIVVASAKTRGTVLAGGAQHALVGADKSFAFPRLAPGTWQLSVLPRSGSTRQPAPLPSNREAPLAQTVIEVAPGERERATLRITGLPAGGAIAGRVRVRGEPGVRMSVRAQPLGPLEGSVRPTDADHADPPGWSDRARSVRTSKDGDYEITGLAPGYYQLSVADEGIVHKPLWASRVRVDLGVERACNVELRLEEVRLHVLDHYRRPVAGMEMLLVGRESTAEGERSTGLHYRAWTDSQGNAVLPRVPAGSYELSGRFDNRPLVVEPVKLAIDTEPLARTLQARSRRSH